MKQFIHSVARLFESDEQREQRELAEIEQRRQARLARQGIVQRCAMFRDRVTAAEQQFARLVEPIDASVKLDKEKFYFQWLTRSGTDPGSMKVGDLGNLLAAHQAIKLEADELRAYLHRESIGVAEAALADFKKEHADVLKNITLEASEEPEFVHQVLPADHYLSGASSALVRAAISPE